MIDGTQAEHLEVLAKVPATIHVRVAAAGLTGVYIGSGPVTELDDMGHLKGKRPLGWPEGTTWDQVRGCYDRKRKTVVCGTGVGGDSAAMPLHEYGHAAADLLGLERGEDAKAWHAKLHDGLPRYFQQDGPGGIKGTQELMAESFAIHWSRGEDALAAWSNSPEYARWFAGQMKEWSGGTEAIT